MLGRELENIRAALNSGHLSGNGLFMQKVHTFFEAEFGIGKALMTHSGTGALEMAALLLNIQPGDEVIMPAYTFVSTANAFALRGAVIRFVDSCTDHPVMDAAKVEALITGKTKAIVAMHYGGVAPDMTLLLDLCIRYSIFLVEDAAHAIGAKYNGLYLGSIGHLSAFSFHETKNIQCGEGGLLAINDERFMQRAEVIWEKGTNRAAFARGETDGYSWIDLGSSFLASEISAAWLSAQLEHFDEVRLHRKRLWEAYERALSPVAESRFLTLPERPRCEYNHHIYAIVSANEQERTALIRYLSNHGFMAVSHYRCLHRSPYYQAFYEGKSLPNAERFEAGLVRLPLFHGLQVEVVEAISRTVKSFYGC